MRLATHTIEQPSSMRKDALKAYIAPSTTINKDRMPDNPGRYIILRTLRDTLKAKHEAIPTSALEIHNDEAALGNVRRATTATLKQWQLPMIKKIENLMELMLHQAGGPHIKKKHSHGKIQSSQLVRK